MYLENVWFFMVVLNLENVRAVFDLENVLYLMLVTARVADERYTNAAS